MAISRLETTFNCDIKKVWEVMTDLNQYSWRSDLSKIEVMEGYNFIEHTNDGYKTTFKTTVFEPYQRWEFQMENDNMIGQWMGEFYQEGNKTRVKLTEDVTAKKVIMKPFVGIYLKKQQARYVSDLQKCLNDSGKINY